jgi:hypothetical protein
MKVVEKVEYAKTILWFLLTTGVLSFILSGCATTPRRNPVPQDTGVIAEIPGFEETRFWGDVPPPWMDEVYTASPAEIESRFSGITGREQHHLTLSGGGQNGAFGAGLLNGWTAAGTRPEFSIVTGVSTGALIAPFAFLGKDYDQRLKDAFTTISTRDILTLRRPLAMLTSDSAASTGPLRRHIAKYVDQQMIDAIAQEHRKGRLLFIGTTNLDQERPVIWNIGRIAARGSPGALELIHSILLASASIPVIFPPVLFEVEADGQRYDEMHVDGGTTRQVFLYPFGIDWERLIRKLDIRGKPKVYVIRNESLALDKKAVELRLIPIAQRSLDTLIRRQGIGDEYQIYLATRRYGFDFNLAYIPEYFQEIPKESFDREYMNNLFNFGYRTAASGFPWKKTPPYYKSR